MWFLPEAQPMRIPAQDPGGPAEVTAKLAAQRVSLRCSLEVAASPRPWLRRRYHLLLPTPGGPCPSIKDNESSSP